MRSRAGEATSEWKSGHDMTEFRSVRSTESVRRRKTGGSTGLSTRTIRTSRPWPTASGAVGFKSPWLLLGG